MNLKNIKEWTEYNSGDDEGWDDVEEPKNIKKPKKFIPVPECIDYHNMIRYIEEKYNIKTDDINRSSNHFKDWMIKNGLPDKDEEGKHWGSSQIYYKKYRKADDGETTKPAHLSFWHWLLKKCFYEVNNPSHQCIPVDHMLKSNKTPDWVKKILKLIKKEFGNEFKNGELWVWFSW